MGYRSQVSAVVYFREPTKYAMFIAKHKALEFTDSSGRGHSGTTTLWAEFGNDFTSFIHRNILLFKAEGYKWYPDYEDVKAFHAMLEDAVEQGGWYYFVRIGEDYEDIETREDNTHWFDGDPYPSDLLSVERSIGCSLDPATAEQP